MIEQILYKLLRLLREWCDHTKAQEPKSITIVNNYYIGDSYRTTYNTNYNYHKDHVKKHKK